MNGYLQRLTARVGVAFGHVAKAGVRPRVAALFEGAATNAVPEPAAPPASGLWLQSDTAIETQRAPSPAPLDPFAPQAQAASTAGSWVAAASAAPTSTADRGTPLVAARPTTAPSASRAEPAALPPAGAMPAQPHERAAPDVPIARSRHDTAPVAGQLSARQPTVAVMPGPPAPGGRATLHGETAAAAAPPPAPISISIGRVDVRAAPAASGTTPRPATPSRAAALPLADYLARRGPR